MEIPLAFDVRSPALKMIVADESKNVTTRNTSPIVLFMQYQLKVYRTVQKFRVEANTMCLAPFDISLVHFVAQGVDLWLRLRTKVATTVPTKTEITGNHATKLIRHYRCRHMHGTVYKHVKSSKDLKGFLPLRAPKGLR